MDKNRRSSNILILIGLLFLIYAFLGNYIALPGYIRFLERGRTSVSGSAFDLSVVIGAVKTLLWMFSFQLGVYFFLLGTLMKAGVPKNILRSTIIGGLLWLIIAGIPKIPGPYRIFYAISGLFVLLFIALVIIYWQRTQEFTEVNDSSLYYKMIGYIFFGLASWDVCGLGTTGRILHLETAVKSDTQGLLMTQTTKIMFEFLLAWGFTFYGHYIQYRDRKYSAKC